MLICYMMGITCLHLVLGSHARYLPHFVFCTTSILVLQLCLSHPTAIWEIVRDYLSALCYKWAWSNSECKIVEHECPKFMGTM